jgi:outer membrane protein TolC
LEDPSINTLIRAALADNPTLAQVAAIVDEARATLRFSNAQRSPQVGISASGSRGTAANPQLTGGSATFTENSIVFGPTLSWELDLWGRLKQSTQAARDRLDARNADAAQTRLALTAEIADGVLSLRACNYSLTVRDRDIASRETELALTRERLRRGNVAPVDEANAATDLATARTDRISQTEQCTRDVDSLATLSGRDGATVRGLLSSTLRVHSVSQEAAPAIEPPPIPETDPADWLPTPPPMRPAVPATVLLSHPIIISAERETAARWSEIAVARAERLPQIDLVAALSGNWLQAFGTHSFFETASGGGNLTGPLFDGGAGVANVRASEARYRQAVENLRNSVRTVAQNVEDALAAQQSAEQRVSTSHDAVVAGRIALRAKEASWRAGAISLFELEDARRQFNTAQESEIAAARDRAQAWVDLVLASADSASVEDPAQQQPDTNIGKQPG